MADRMEKKTQQAANAKKGPTLISTAKMFHNRYNGELDYHCISVSDA